MGAYLSQPNTEKESESGEGERMAYGCTSMQGWRQTMEDALVTELELPRVEGVDEPVALFGVFDGHGGREVAHYARKNIARTLVGSAAYKQKDLGTALCETFVALDEQMLTPEGRRQLAQYKAEKRDLDDEDEMDQGIGSQAGSTAVCAAIQGSTLVVANAGDSRGVLCRNGVAVDLSKDHKPNDELERQRILRAGGFVNDGRVNGSLALSRALGDFEFKQSATLQPKDQVISCFPDIRQETIGAEDEFMVLACDGIWDVMKSQECIDFTRQHIKNGVALAEICEMMCDFCIAPDTKASGGLGCDNMSVVIVTFRH
mmetsp:Transcript_5203/g.18201  ORF Transcript_5203/g.18201 Transcript_5203/m.18201 type:complete len:316 (+) Transcript_5203:955-1902(+)